MAHELLEREHLHPYQKRAISFVKKTPSCALWMDMGLGKTVTTLTALSDLFEEFSLGKVLILGPRLVVQHTWLQELSRWAHLKDLKATVLSGTPSQRFKKLQENTPLHVLSVDLVPWLVSVCGSKWPYDTVVIDELSRFKSPQAQRFKALKKVLPKVKRVIGLTGTPASNGLLDLWSQTYLLDQGQRLGRTFSGFRSRYFTSDYMGYTWTPKPQTAQDIPKKLQDLCLTLSAKEYLDLPPVRYQTLDIPLPKAAWKAYRDLERLSLLTLSEEATLEAPQAATLVNKLLQFANGAVYHDDEKNWTEVHSAKLEALEELLEAAQGRPVLVGYTYQSDRQRLLQHFPKAKWLQPSQGTGLLETWNAGEIPILLAHPASAAHGLNLQAGGELIVWFGLPWSLELYQQFNARLARQGQKNPVLITHLAAQGTIDETVLAALAKKDLTQCALLNALKAKHPLKGDTVCA